MATVTFTFANKSKSYTISAGSAQRFSDWATAAYPTIPNPSYNPALPPTGGNTPTIANPDPVTSAIDALWAGIKANVMGNEKDVAVKAITPPADLT